METRQQILDKIIRNTVAEIVQDDGYILTARQVLQHWSDEPHLVMRMLPLIRLRFRQAIRWGQAVG